MKSETESCSVVSHFLQPPGLCSPWNSPGQNAGVGITFPFSRRSSQPRDWTQVSHIAGRFFTSWPRGKPRNTGVGSLFLLQQMFLTKELTGVSCIAGGFFTNWVMISVLYSRSLLGICFIYSIYNIPNLLISNLLISHYTFCGKDLLTGIFLAQLTQLS